MTKMIENERQGRLVLFTSIVIVTVTIYLIDIYLVSALTTLTSLTILSTSLTGLPSLTIFATISTIIVVLLTTARLLAGVLRFKFRVIANTTRVGVYSAVLCQHPKNLLDALDRWRGSSFSEIMEVQ